MKNLTSPLALCFFLLLLLVSCEKEETTLTLDAQEKSGKTIVQKVDLFTFLPAGEGTGVLPTGTYYPPTNSHATLKRGRDFLQFNLHADGLPPGAYTVWWVIFNAPTTCGFANPAGGDCGGDPEMQDLFLPTTGIVWATGGVVRENGIGNFSDRLKVGERRIPGEQEVIVGAGIESALDDPQNAEVHLIVKYHGPASSDPDILALQTETFLGLCGEMDGSNAFYAGPVFGWQCFDPQAGVFPAP